MTSQARRDSSHTHRPSYNVPAAVNKHNTEQAPVRPPVEALEASASRFATSEQRTVTTADNFTAVSSPDAPSYRPHPQTDGFSFGL